MAVNSLNLVLGPARLYLAPYGTTPPADSAVTPNGPTNPPSSPWTDVGGTDGGVTFTAEGTLTDLVVDQVIMPVGSRLTDLKMSIQTKLAEVTLSNMNSALNGIMSTSTNTGYNTADITVSSAATQPTYLSLIMDGWAPSIQATGASALRRILVYKALATPKVSLTADKKTQASYDVTWNVYFVSSSANPVHIVDQTA